MKQEDSMSDDVFESPDDKMAAVLNPPTSGRQPRTPSPTGYKDYKPPAHLFKTEEPEIAHKTILLGDSGVGKTSLLVQFNTGSYQTGNFSATVGIGFTNKIVSVDDCNVKLQIWDTAGQERFRSVTHAYYRDAHALLLLFDVTNRQSFNNVKAWLGEIREYAQEDVVIMLLGNKSDCNSSDRQVKKDEGDKLARDYKVTYMETSAKTGLNVELAFMAIARELKSRKAGTKDGSTFNVQDYVREQTQKVNCTLPTCGS